MAGIAAEFDLDQLTRTLGAMVPSSMPKTIADVSTYLSSSVRRRFDTQTDPDGNAWEPLKQPRQRKRDKVGGTGQKVLTDTGPLKASASGQALGSVRQAGPLSLVQGTVLQCAAIHNFGGVVDIPEQIRASGQKPFAWKNGEGRTVFSRRIRARKVTIPKRQFIGLSDRDRLRIEQIAADNLARGTP